MISSLFQFHILNDEGRLKAQSIAHVFNDLLVKLQPLIPLSSRETSIVRTKLEEACFYAKKAMSVSPENQSGE